MKPLNTENVKLEADGNELYEDGKRLKPGVRTLEEMKTVLLDPEYVNSSNGSQQLYFMYRAPGVERHKELFSKHKMRYDVTIIAGATLGREFNKTFGHYHAIAEQGLSYPELYEVISGDAILLMQKDLGEKGMDVRMAAASTGDRIVVPPNYGHITINTGKEQLIMSNLMSSVSESDYKPMELMRGGAVYALKDGSYVINRNYKRLSVVDLDEVEQPEFMGDAPSIYDAFIENPDSFAFLNRPSLMRSPYW